MSYEQDEGAPMRLENAGRRARLAAAKVVGRVRAYAATLAQPTKTERTLDSVRIAVARRREDLAGKRVLVTGSTRGIGRAIASAFARCGAKVIVHGRRDADARRVAGELGSDAVGVGCDLSAVGAGKALVEEAMKRLGGIDIVVNNAAIHDPKRKNAWLTPSREMHEVLCVNVLAPFDIAAAAIASMKERGEAGRILNISSRAADTMAQPPPSGIASYGISKVALEGLSTYLAVEAHPVVVSTLRPSAVETDMTRALFPWDEHARMLPPESMVGPTMFLATAPPEEVHGKFFDQLELLELLEGEARTVA